MKAAHVAVAWCRVQEIRASRSFFERCGIPPMLTASASDESRVRGKEPWNPTSREKRARYGAPVLCEGARAYEAEFTLAHQGGQGILDRGCLPGRNRVAPEA